MQQMIETLQRLGYLYNIGKTLTKDCEWWHHFFLKVKRQAKVLHCHSVTHNP
jgi:hypothetical protein